MKGALFNEPHGRRKNLMLARGANALDKFYPTQTSFAPYARCT